MFPQSYGEHASAGYHCNQGQRASIGIERLPAEHTQLGTRGDEVSDRRGRQCDSSQPSGRFEEMRRLGVGCCYLRQTHGTGSPCRQRAVWSRTRSKQPVRDLMPGAWLIRKSYPITCATAAGQRLFSMQSTRGVRCSADRSRGSRPSGGCAGAVPTPCSQRTGPHRSEDP